MARETNYLLPEDSQDVLSMPNIEKEVAKEVDRITLSLIEEIQEVFNVGISYDSIEYVEDELKPAVTIDYLLNDIRNFIRRAINDVLGLKDSNYINYLKLFTVTGYDETTGKAKVKIDIPLPTVSYTVKIDQNDSNPRIKVN